jgi:hypothetical protein
MCHEPGPGLIRSADYVEDIKSRLSGGPPLDFAAIERERQLERELACPCTTPADRERIRRTQAMFQRTAPPTRRRGGPDPVYA